MHILWLSNLAVIGRVLLAPANIHHTLLGAKIIWLSLLLSFARSWQVLKNGSHPHLSTAVYHDWHGDGWWLTRNHIQCTQCWPWRKPSPGLKTRENGRKTLWAKWRSDVNSFTEFSIAHRILEVTWALKATDTMIWKAFNTVWLDSLYTCHQKRQVEELSTATEPFTPPRDCDQAPLCLQLQWMIRIIH